MSRRKWPAQTTWVMRQLGEAFNPDAVCEYTGLALYMHPIRCGTCEVWPEPWSMGFWRTDGHLRAVAKCTPAELAWLSSNPEAYEKEHAQFETWLRSTSTRKQP